MEDKYMLYDVLESVKNMVVNYSIALNEASSENIYKEYKNQFDKISKITKDIFNYAYSNDWYTLEEAVKTKITKEYDKLNKELGC